MSEVKFLILGGYPKGHLVAFSTMTLSGKRLRPIVSASRFTIAIHDLWDNEIEETVGLITPMKRRLIESFIREGFTILAAGHTVERALQREGFSPIYLPHPASRIKDPMKEWRAILDPFEPAPAPRSDRHHERQE